MGKRRMLFFVVLVLTLLLSAAARAADVPHGEGRERALLVGIDEFVSCPSAYPSSTNNVYAMQAVFQNAARPLEALIVPDEPVTAPEILAKLIHETFGEAQEGDISYLYLSTHGQFDPVTGEARLLLSDGQTENGITPAQLEAAFAGVGGMKVLILDACNSGAFIGKGMSQRPQALHFLGADFKVLASSGALEESWYWSGGDDLSGAQGAFYFTQALTQALSPATGYPADQNRDGCVTLAELYLYLLLNHAASTPQVYPQNDDAVIFRYDSTEDNTASLKRAPIVDVTFSGTTLSREERRLTIEFIATRPIRVAYQIVYQRDGRWEFDRAQLIYDGAERFTAFGDQPGGVSAGRKVRTVSLDRLDSESCGYVLVQLVSIDEGKLTVHAGRVISVPPATGQIQLTAEVDERLELGSGRELCVFVAHDAPCALSVAIVDETEKVVHRICHRQSTRPVQTQPAGTAFYWDGTLRDGSQAACGSYRVRVQAHVNDASATVLSSTFEIVETDKTQRRKSKWLAN